MKLSLIALAVALTFCFTSTMVAAAPPAATRRNLDWAAVTLDKIEKDLAEAGLNRKPVDAAALAGGFKSARSRLAALKTAAAAGTPDSDTASRAIEFARTISNLAQVVVDHLNDQDGKREAFRRLMEDNPDLSKTDLEKRFEQLRQSLAGDLVRLTALQLEDKAVDATQAEGAWNLDALRCDQLNDEGSEEAGYLKQREELENNLREANKTISLAPFDAAREKVRAARRRQQEQAVEKQKITNQISVANLQTQLLDQQGGKLGDAVDLARQAYDQAHDSIQEAIDN